MKYVEQVLQPGETVVYATTLHWLVYLRALMFFALAIVCLIVAGYLEPGGLDTALKVGAALLCMLGIVSALSALVRRATTELAVTDRRVIFKTGIFQRHTLEMNLSKVETVGVNQSILGACSATARSSCAAPAAASSRSRSSASRWPSAITSRRARCPGPPPTR